MKVFSVLFDVKVAAFARVVSTDLFCHSCISFLQLGFPTKEILQSPKVCKLYYQVLVL
ncbi:hypothetical protein VDG1235_4742 [Verrucomicrobiia bacterium DG1235]|nr:hypothetical protein VDG1235_4742 [Verrucomicrobiae bacterium DG1235]